MRTTCTGRFGPAARVGLTAAVLGAAAATATAQMPGMGFIPIPIPNTGRYPPLETRPFSSAHDVRDLRDEGVITPARDQGSCGACWAFAAITCVETACLLRDPSLDCSTFDLSEQHLVSCDNQPWQLPFGTTCNYGCLGGSAVAFEFMRHNGIAAEENLPYASGGGGSGTCPPDPPGLSGWQVLDWGFVRPDAGVPSVGDLKSAIDAYGAIWAGFLVYADFMDGAGGGFWYEADEGEIYRHVAGERVGAHAVAVIGYDDLQGCWIAKNSWGNTAGPDQDGTFRIAYDADCSFGLNAAWVRVDFFGAPSHTLDTTWGALKAMFADR